MSIIAKMHELSFNSEESQLSSNFFSKLSLSMSEPLATNEPISLIIHNHSPRIEISDFIFSRAPFRFL